MNAIAERHVVRLSAQVLFLLAVSSVLRVAGSQLTVGWSVLITVTAIDTPLGAALERIQTVLLLGWIALSAAALRHHALGMMWSRQSTSRLQRAD